MSFLRTIRSGNQSDQELLQTYQQNGELSLLAALYERYMDLVHGVCIKYLQDSETAKDAVMNIFEELITKARKHEIQNFKSWLHTLARNHCLMQLRTPRNLKTVEISHSLMQSEDFVHLNGTFDKEEHLQRLSYCLSTLSAEQKKSVELFYLEKKCYNEIVELTGYDWSKVRSYIQNGRRNLKSCMEQNAGQEN